MFCNYTKLKGWLWLSAGEAGERAFEVDKYKAEVRASLVAGGEATGSQFTPD